MPTLPVEKMRELERRFGEIEARMSAGPAADVYVKLASEYSELQPVVTKIRAYERRAPISRKSRRCWPIAPPTATCASSPRPSGRR